MHGGKNVFISVTYLRSWPSRHQHEVWSLQQLLVSLCVCLLSFKLGSSETWNKHYITGVHHCVILFDFLQSLIIAWQMYEFVRKELHLQQFIQNSENMCGTMSSNMRVLLTFILLTWRMWW